MSINLHTLPPELLRHILLHADITTVKAIHKTCQALRQAAEDEILWRAKVQRRFRVSSNVIRSRRLLASGGVSWRFLYAQWHSSSRMPLSRLSGNAYTVFARGRSHDQTALLWVTVVSTDDCRLVRGNLRLRVILQNVAGGHPMRFHLAHASFHLTDHTVVSVDDHALTYVPLQTQTQPAAASRSTSVRRVLNSIVPSFPQLSTAAESHKYFASASQCLMARADDCHPRLHAGEARPLLEKDDFAVFTVDLMMPAAVFEVDALERLCSLQIPVSWGSAQTTALTAHFQDRAIWDNYKRLPGGWWVRAEPSSACGL